MDTTPGRRQKAKASTRRAIRRAALQMFGEQGYDAVTTSEVAAAAGVSPATLFNYFATKEDLFFGEVDQLESRLVSLVAACGPGEPILAALTSNVLYELTAGRSEYDPGAVATFHHQVARSQQLQAREHEIYDRREAVLATALVAAMDCSADPLPARVAAALYIAAEKLVATELRRRFDEASPAEALRRTEVFIEEVFASISVGLGDLPARNSP